MRKRSSVTGPSCILNILFSPWNQQKSSYDEITIIFDTRNVITKWYLPKRVQRCSRVLHCFRWLECRRGRSRIHLSNRNYVKTFLRRDRKWGRRGDFGESISGSDTFFACKVLKIQKKREDRIPWMECRAPVLLKIQKTRLTKNNVGFVERLLLTSDFNGSILGQLCTY